MTKAIKQSLDKSVSELLAEMTVRATTAEENAVSARQRIEELRKERDQANARAYDLEKQLKADRQRIDDLHGELRREQVKTFEVGRELWRARGYIAALKGDPFDPPALSAVEAPLNIDPSAWRKA